MSRSRLLPTAARRRYRRAARVVSTWYPRAAASTIGNPRQPGIWFPAGTGRRAAAILEEVRRCGSRAFTELTFHSRFSRRGGCRGQPIENELPQPQDEAAFGLRIWNEAPIRSSTKSTSAPFSKSTRPRRQPLPTPSRSNTKSSSLRWSSKVSRIETRSIRPPTPQSAERVAGAFLLFQHRYPASGISVTTIPRGSTSPVLSAMSTFSHIRRTAGLSFM